MFQLLTSGKRYRSLRAWTCRLRDSFSPPGNQAHEQWKLTDACLPLTHTHPLRRGCVYTNTHNYANNAQLRLHTHTHLYYIIVFVFLLFCRCCRRSQNPRVLLSYTCIVGCNNKGILNLDNSTGKTPPKLDHMRHHEQVRAKGTQLKELNSRETPCLPGPSRRC